MRRQPDVEALAVYREHGSGFVSSNDLASWRASIVRKLRKDRQVPRVSGARRRLSLRSSARLAMPAPVI